MKKFITNPIRVLAQRIVKALPTATPGTPGALPEETPNEIFEQVRPLLTKMGLANISDRTKTSIVEGEVQGKNSLYQIFLRRIAVITPDIIDRIKRNEAFLNQIMWDAKAMVVQVWWPYQTAAEKAAPTPARPGIPQAVPPAPPK